MVMFFATKSIMFIKVTMDNLSQEVITLRNEVDRLQQEQRYCMSLEADS